MSEALLKAFRAFALAALLPLSTAHAAPSTVFAYQEMLLEAAREELGLRPEANPVGKRIERIEIVTLNVFVRQDPWPEFPNAIHSVTKKEVVERELLFGVGDRWEGAVIEETGRNLRSNLFVSIARVEPCQGSTPDSVVALVLTKDMWSFRPSIKFTLVGPTLQNFEIFLAEYNVAGHTKVLGLDAGLDIQTTWLGQQIRDPRLLGSRIALRERGDLIWNRYSGVLEGGIFNLEVERPLFRLSEEWAWRQTLEFRRDIYRLYQGSSLTAVPLTTGEVYPLNYRRQEARWEGIVERSTGDLLHKKNYGVGARVWGKQYGANETAFSAVGQAEFEQSYIPFSESAVALFLRLRHFHPDYRQLSNIERFALTEDYMEGPDWDVDLQWALPIPGQTAPFVEARARNDWVMRTGEDNYFTWGFNLGTRYQPLPGTTNPWTNQVVVLRARNVSPKILDVFRIVASGRITRRIRDLTRTIETLGGEGPLRGYPSGFFFGNETWGANIEARSVPWVYKTLHLGAVAFLDVGDAYSFTRDAGIHASVGFGFRMAFPQFNRSLMRLDFGFPLENLAPATPSYVTFTFGQAFF